MRKKKTHIIILYGFIGLLLGGCIHQYPEGGNGQTPVTVTVDIEIDMDLPAFQTISRTTRAPLEGHERRFVIDVFQGGKAVSGKRIVTTDAEEVEEGKFIIPVSLQLEAQEYTLAVWSDFVKQGTQEDLHFNTEALTHVHLNEPYHHDCNRREAFCGMAALNLTPYAGGQDVQIRQHIGLKRPQAKFRIISTDTEEFVTRVHTRGDTPGNHRVKVSYEYFLPTAYNIMDDVLCGSQAGMGFTAPCSLETDEDGHCELAADYVFAGKDATYLSLTLEVLDGNGEAVSRVTGVQVPFRQGELTIVTGKFLTTMMRPGISIDTDYEGEFNITLP